MFAMLTLFETSLNDNFRESAIHVEIEAEDQIDTEKVNQELLI